jgi:hypothetical protein
MNLYAMEMLARQKVMEAERAAKTAWYYQEKKITQQEKVELNAVCCEPNACCTA